MSEGHMLEGEGTVLLVEDNADDVRLITRAFHKVTRNGTLQPVEDADQAIAYLSGQAPYGEARPIPAVVLLDLKLPRKSGFEVLEWVKAQPELRRIPIVVLTSSKERIDLQRAYDRGANSYLVKPVRSAALLKLMREVDTYWLSVNERPPFSNGAPVESDERE